MTKLIATALLSLGFASAAMAADMPKSAAPMAADAGTTANAPAKNTTKGKHSGKKGKKSTKPAPTTTK